MNRYLIIADDFTGANDTGVQLTRRGIRTSVSLMPQGIGDDRNSHVLDTESRGLSAKAAADKVASMIRPLDFAKFGRVIKKVDSTLRGSIAAEIKAVDTAFASELIVFMPALPALGRTTVDGMHRLGGVRITETELAKDPKNPVTDDHLVSILKGVYDEEIGLVTIAQIRGGDLALDGKRIWAADAETNQDMQQVMAAALATGKRVLWVGTAAIADNLLEMEACLQPSMALVTSVSDVSRGQVRHCEEAGVKLVTVPVHELLGGGDQGIYAARTLELLGERKDVILLSSSSYDRDEIAKNDAAGERLGMDRHQVGEATQRLMAGIARSVIERQRISGLFLTGGDTAIGFFEQVGASGSEILGEVSTGIPMMKLNGGVFDGLKVITKAGAFGNADAIAYALRKLKEIPCVM